MKLSTVCGFSLTASFNESLSRWLAQDIVTNRVLLCFIFIKASLYTPRLTINATSYWTLVNLVNLRREAFYNLNQSQEFDSQSDRTSHLELEHHKVNWYTTCFHPNQDLHLLHISFVAWLLLKRASRNICLHSRQQLSLW